MAPESAALLAATWSWADAVLSVLLLGVLVPAGVAMTFATLLLGVQRRDWRLVPGAVLATAVITVAGLFALSVVQPPAPAADYWAGLSLTLGAMVLGAALVAVVLHGRRQAIESRNLRELLKAPLAVQPEAGAMPKPAPRRHLNAVTAEHHVAEWMRHLGATDSVVTPFRRDGGVDVRSARFVAQVKHRSDLVPVEAMRALVGAAALEGRQALFFTSGTYSRDAIATASAGQVALFIFRPREGALVAANALAQQLRASGLGAVPASQQLHRSADRRVAVGPS